ncbi:NRDE family protein [Halomonas sp. 18H]|uniref:NRDE family protein n=1 Tax=Halomonas almeriensis TaxID=308163 RepID=UPI00222E4C1F|nr:MULTISPECIES: NRDE family protein [Halomonas]MCW4149501.1 NRDE family protein [Halomonas sp. 18H]MDN3553553.1 NRDE family protein [Halomonas almeriensis]
MCLIALEFRPENPTRLRLMANRDEFHTRPSAGLGAWKDAPSIIGGRDLQGGGGWMAMHRQGRFAAVTNVRDPGLVVPASAPSRGDLVRTALECEDLAQWLRQLAQGDAWHYAGFNLLASDGEQLWHLYRGQASLELSTVPPGIHGLSNASLNTPWPKVLNVCRGLAESRGQDWPARALAHFGDTAQAADHRLPDTGIEPALERRLSSAFILGEDYGTRSTTWLEWYDSGDFFLQERRYAPWGRWLGERQHDTRNA